ncbi:hypothetical protein ColLi_03960 [Colletotrichum liriopes]|uniref:Uncharacterized protein n=1 Tax=Colletotrichum liriopes TaxID=708192 RepID=A0AA37GIJ4_9PEZI|nr:hypothetical protein ColLi_03960 [Colletotrichum liriopes]
MVRADVEWMFRCTAREVARGVVESSEAREGGSPKSEECGMAVVAKVKSDEITETSGGNGQRR